MQTEFYRDLVTPIDPTSKFSFLNYLKAQARLDQFFCSSTIYPTRREFEDYFRWVAGQIGEVIFGVEVNCVDYDAKKTCSSSMPEPTAAARQSTSFLDAARGQGPESK